MAGRSLLLLLGVVGLSTALTVRVCCPLGTAFKENPDYDYDDYESHARTCQAHPGEELVWAENPDVVLEGEEEHKCKSNGTYVNHVPLPGFVPQQLLDNGTLSIAFENETTLYPPGMFCLHFKHTAASAGNETDDESEDGSGVSAEEGITTEYFLCEADGASDAAKFTSTIYPIPIFISAFFILLTIVVYLLLKDNRSKLFGKLTIGFLINVFLAFFFTGVHYSLNVAENREWLDTPFCKALGYIVQHTWISFFLWMSAMAINITTTFAQSFRAKGQGRKQTTALILNILYAQGIPLVITVVTLIMDLQRPDGAILPHMGQFTCGLGSEYSSVPEAFYKWPKFLYFYLAISVIFVINIICFAITGGNLISHWTQMKEMKKNGQSHGMGAQIRILGNLFVIMGIPWIFEFISGYLTYSDPDSYELQFALDIVNMLQGIFIFIALVCKVQVLKPLKASLSSLSGSDHTSTSKTSTVSMVSSSRKSSTARVPRSGV